jgi:hypothetical protein
VSIDASSLLDNLNLALMVSGTARKGRWPIGTDVIYLDSSGANSSLKRVDLRRFLSNDIPSCLSLSSVLCVATTVTEFDYAPVAAPG